ncbi:hypothetical protein AAV35_000380 [Salimicrobium jeotgali]|uniref:Putative transcriptional regulator n=1 Tax=Salimicrobium jeotgali TaxID=1230341 RepID=K2H4H2_9BACI|nr:helix-turn-helix transcriptional regulator [Salimicrobium jeotgali]AKG03389.1 hypothetical protein AAV35_000380 [Salimicrobium jeotgali]EKE30775.1 putative transcriptional regulator [Salimicrobium jeotgali]MBM7697548.1 tetratricopeptide (TPR) repeat protein [Salimicrobium jeotgali]
MSSIGNRIKELRKKGNLTQMQLSDGIVTRSYLSQIEKGSAQPSYETVVKFSEKLGCEVEDLYKEPENKTYILSRLKNDLFLLEGKINDGNFKDSETLLSKIKLDFYEELNTSEKGLLEWCRGKIFENKKKWNQANSHYMNSIHFYTNAHNTTGEIRSKNSLAFTKIKQNKNVEAYNILRSCYNLALQTSLGGPMKTSILINFGHVHMQLKEYFSAISFFWEAYELNLNTNVHVKVGETLLMLGICYKEIEEFNRAEEMNNKALTYFKALSNEEDLANVYNNLGNLYLTMNEYEKAIENFLLASDKFEENSHLDGMMISTIGLASSFYQNNQLTNCSRICYQIISKNSGPQYQGFAYLLLGNVEFEKGKLEKSLENYLLAKNIFTEADIKWGVNKTLSKEAIVRSELGYYEEALEIFKSIDLANDDPLFIN